MSILELKLKTKENGVLFISEDNYGNPQTT